MDIYHVSDKIRNETPSFPINLNPANITRELFEPALPLKIIIHGFVGHRDYSPNIEVRPALLQYQQVYVLTVDYGTIAELPCYYPWAVSNAGVVSKCLALLIDNLIDDGIYRSEDVHIIGFSLGAQIAGITANYLRNRLRRITGLDPAGPAFATDNLSHRLDPSDADFIDIIHTDPFGLSTIATLGHVDFYPNLGQLSQPGCGIGQEGRIVNCNHYRAPRYYAESIKKSQEFWAYNCGNWLHFLLQRCNEYVKTPQTKMGYYVSEDAVGSYFLTTHSKTPYAKGPLKT
ncbi:inactive pancreatic lipase-related protein 1 [Teleopsis dalmanni]|uniref:inactive pancreatic lipase-related protein 1 n=1 Tax=Teleopsis dalmanni TaxID=139649 RepID=UPI0018CDCD7D|nr:inactive pancreatic lipase-related protein 1 [Teleopsis dalmanni]